MSTLGLHAWSIHNLAWNEKMTIANDQLSQKSIKLKNCDDRVILLFQSCSDLFVHQHFSMVKDYVMGGD